MNALLSLGGLLCIRIYLKNVGKGGMFIKAKSYITRKERFYIISIEISTFFKKCKQRNPKVFVLVNKFISNIIRLILMLTIRG